MKKLFLLPLLALCIFGISCVYAVEIQENLSGGLIRMHIIANSNSQKDQDVKLAVRNDILNSINEKSSLDDIENAASNSLSRQGASYGADVLFERSYVPEKTYKSLTLPEGVYNCIKVVLGSGAGENWWCVAYPPLCFTEEVFGDLTEDAEALLKENLSHEALKTIINSGNVNFRFKIVEEIQKLRYRF